MDSVVLKMLDWKPLITSVKRMERAEDREERVETNLTESERGGKRLLKHTSFLKKSNPCYTISICEKWKHPVSLVYRGDDNMSAVASVIWMEKVCELHLCVSYASGPARDSCLTPPLLLENLHRNTININ